MAQLKELSEELSKLNKQIKTVLDVSKFREYDDLSALDDWKNIKNADDMQLLEEYREILYKLDEIQCCMDYLEKPVCETDRIYRSESGRYETDKGYSYTSGSSIEFLRTQETYNSNTGTWENTEIWTSSRVEHNGTDYYIVGYPDVKMQGLKVRFRK